MQTFSDKIAIVTGGGSGIGAALCEALAVRGAIVVAADKNGPAAQRTVAALQERDARAQAQTVDVTNEAEVVGLVERTVAKYGRLDYFFNNAGIGVAGDARDLKPEHWRRIMDVNLWGVIYGTAAAYDVMQRQGDGHIVNVASLSGLLPHPSSIPYATTKHAVVGLSLSWRAEAADLGVRVSVACPAFVQTQVLESATVLNVSRAQMAASVPFKILGAQTAARNILDGVARNKATIVFPGYARLFWWLHRINASLTDPILRKMIRDFRGLRFKSPSVGAQS